MPASTHPILPALLLCLVTSAFAAEKTEGVISVSHGEKIDVAEYLAPGKTVIFSFLSEFSPPCPCEPCDKLGDPLSALQAARADLIVVKVDIDRAGQTQIDWNSPVAQQFGLRRVPHFLVYGPDGAMIAADDSRSTSAAAGRDMVHAMLMELPLHAEASSS
ncbi:MAG: hypothetical protein SynsKO_19890 [Synoicihabitans sp.]